jgi:hypothetical protein
MTAQTFEVPRLRPSLVPIVPYAPALRYGRQTRIAMRKPDAISYGKWSELLRIRVAESTRERANSLCNRLEAAGGCIVFRH